MLTSDTLEWAAGRIPDSVAWSFGATRRSFAEADQCANRVANALLDLGFTPRERVAILATNSDQSAELFFALGKAGLVAVPLNIRSSPAEIRFIAEQARPSGFVVSAGLADGFRAIESGGRITHLSPEQHRRLVASAAGQTDAWGREVMPCGLEQPGFEIRLEDDDGNEVAEDAVGELVVRGDSVFKGYWNLPELDAEVLRDGWWRGGDLARRGSDGNLYIVDRKKDMIVSGGYNIYSVEVEQVLARHPDVAQVAVIGLPNPRWGESVCAFVVPRPGVDPDERELDTLCRATLAAYKIPKRYVFVDTLPMTTTGKIRKAALRDRAVADGTVT